MISRLAGTLLEVNPPQVVVDVHGVAYEVEVPNGVLDGLPPVGQGVVLLTHLQIAQDHHTLYGFASVAERRLFRQLMKVSGIGAKSALNILSGASGEHLARWVAESDVAALTRLPGVGKKTAERIIVELRDRMAEFAQAVSPVPTAGGSAQREAGDALRSLGYRPAEVAQMLREVNTEGMSAEEIIRKALQQAAA